MYRFVVQGKESKKSSEWEWICHGDNLADMTDRADRWATYKGRRYISLPSRVIDTSTGKVVYENK